MSELFRAVFICVLSETARYLPYQGGGNSTKFTSKSFGFKIQTVTEFKRTIKVQPKSLLPLHLDYRYDNTCYYWQSSNSNLPSLLIFR